MPDPLPRHSSTPTLSESALDAAVRASLRGVNLDPVPIEVAIQNPRNRQAVERAIQAALPHLLNEWADRIEADRREPDKLLCHVLSMRGAALRADG